MNRSPYYSPLARAADLEGGGAADLQTDIMRFMAILALCLVAIFALVQSIPLQSVPLAKTEPPPVAPMQRSERPETLPKPATASDHVADFSQADEPLSYPSPGPEPLAELEPSPERNPVAEAKPPVALKPSPGREPAASETSPPAPPTPAPADTPSASPVNPPPRKDGFTLRFDSDTALTRLVARNDVGLYAIADARALRMSASRGRYSFWPASAPGQFHEMEAATVPADVIAALRRAGEPGPDAGVTWAVTLPVRMRQQLDRYLTEHTAGALVIEGSGNLRLEP